jgi:hypothetical protein
LQGADYSPHYARSKEILALRSVLLILLLARSVAGAVSVVPVATAQYRDRFYSTTLVLRNPTRTVVRCESVYAIPNDPRGGTCVQITS